MLSAFVCPFDLVKTWEFINNHEESFEVGYKIWWHSICGMPRQEAISTTLQDQRPRVSQS
jgi:hypothetical protein